MSVADNSLLGQLLFADDEDNGQEPLPIITREQLMSTRAIVFLSLFSPAMSINFVTLRYAYPAEQIPDAGKLSVAFVGLSPPQIKPSHVVFNYGHPMKPIVPPPTESQSQNNLMLVGTNRPMDYNMLLRHSTFVSPTMTPPVIVRPPGGQIPAAWPAYPGQPVEQRFVDLMPHEQVFYVTAYQKVNPIFTDFGNRYFIVPGTAMRPHMPMQPYFDYTQIDDGTIFPISAEQQNRDRQVYLERRENYHPVIVNEAEAQYLSKYSIATMPYQQLLACIEVNAHRFEEYYILNPKNPAPVFFFNICPQETESPLPEDLDPEAELASHDDEDDFDDEPEFEEEEQQESDEEGQDFEVNMEVGQENSEEMSGDRVLHDEKNEVKNELPENHAQNASAATDEHAHRSNLADVVVSVHFPTSSRTNVEYTIQEFGPNEFNAESVVGPDPNQGPDIMYATRNGIHVDNYCIRAIAFVKAQHIVPELASELPR